MRTGNAFSVTRCLPMPAGLAAFYRLVLFTSGLSLMPAWPVFVWVVWGIFAGGWPGCGGRRVFFRNISILLTE